MTVESMHSPTDGLETEPLRARLEVEPASSATCPAIAEAPNAAAVTRNCADDTCHSELTVVEDGTAARRYVSGPTTSECVCQTVGQFDCAFDVTSIRRGSLVIELVVDDRTLLGRIVDELEATGATVQLCRLSRLSSTGDASLEIDATAVTEKQREAVELAVELGYYDRPRTATLSDLADRLAVSKSAVSQRLTAVELTLVRSLVDR